MNNTGMYCTVLYCTGGEEGQEAHKIKLVQERRLNLCPEEPQQRAEGQGGWEAHKIKLVQECRLHLCPEEPDQGGKGGAVEEGRRQT